MKPHGDDSSSRSCSCTCCFYKSESEHPSTRRMLAKGSRIDKLYIGKYLPLREEKLLNRLVRTRAIYDDIRTQLVSASNITESDKGDLKPAKQMPLKRKGKRKPEELCDAEQSVVLKLINLVNKGANLGPHRLSECYSCCVCGPKHNKFANTGRLQKHRHTQESSRSSFTSGIKTRDERRFARHAHRARLIKSDPDNRLCTNEDNDLSVRESKATMKKDLKPRVVSKGKVGGRETIKGYKSVQCESETSSRSMSKLRSKIKNSTEVMKTTEQRVRGEVRKHTKKYTHSEILNSLMEDKHRKQTKEELELEVNEAIAQIQKDSLTKYREAMKKKKFNEKCVCDFGCDLEECEPEECLKIKMQQKIQSGEKKVQYKKKNIRYTTRILSKTRMSQSIIPEPTVKTEIKKQETKSVDLKKNAKSNKPQIKSKTKHEETDTNQLKKNSKSRVVCVCRTTTSSTNISKGFVKSLTEPPSTTTKWSSASETIRPKQPKSKKINVIQRPKRNVRSSEYALKRCFCTLKLRPKGNRLQRPQSSDSKSLQTKAAKTQSTTASTEIKNIKQQKTLTICRCANSWGLQHRTKSTSSLMSSDGTKSVQAHSLEKVDEVWPSEQLVIRRNDDDGTSTSNKQAVRISPNLSFKIEVYKKTPSPHKISAIKSETQSQVTYSQKRTRKSHSKVGKHKHLARKPSQITSSTKSKNMLTKLNLRRWISTLKFAKKNVICECAPKAITYSKSTVTSGQNFTEKPILRTLGTEKRQKPPKYAKYQLLPYECEPGIRVPGKCDPYQCLEFINKRNAKLTSRAFRTFNCKTRSTYSITGRRGGRSKTKEAQSVSATHKENKSLVMSQRKVISSPSRQAVKIESSLNFDKGFYKKKPKVTQQNIEIVKEPSSSAKIKTRGKHGRKHQKSISIQSNTKENRIFVGSTMNRCFCTFKLQKKAKTQVVSCECSTAATETVPAKDTVHPDMVTKSTKTKKKTNRQLVVLPYECEPDICIPGECDPYQFSERIKLTNKKLKDFGTETNKNISKSAALATSSLSRDTSTLSNFGKARKKRKRSKYTTSSNYPRLTIPVVSPRRAVRFESHFSYNVGFAKDRPQEEQLADKPLMKKPFRNVRVKQEGENPNKLKLPLSESQSVTVKNINKCSGIKPSILKRCFCTLKLQNKKADINQKMITKPIEAIVMPAQIFNKSFARSQYEINHNKYVERKTEPDDIDRSFIKLYPPMATKFNTMNWLKRNISTLSTEFPFNINKLLTREEWGSIDFEENISKDKTMEYNLRRTELTAVSPNLKKSFYALNLHIQNRSRSTSNDGTYVRSSQQQFGRTRQERAGEGRNPRDINYESPPTQTHKQAVRIGSTFSFDIDFFKDKSSPGNKGVVQEKRRKNHSVGSGGRTVRRIDISTSGTQVLRRDKSSLSSNLMLNKRQNITRPKRCFCSLKLQKMGKQHVQVGHEAKPPLRYTNVCQNTKNPYRLSDLDPNECKPGIPGAYDPYECLERIKRRRLKDIGSGMRPSLMSLSSMTSQFKKHAKEKHVSKYKNKKKPKETKTKSTVSSVSRPRTKISLHSSRQAVRIGSSFSFNVELAKDMSPGQGDSITASGAASVKKTKENNGPSTRAIGTKTGAFLKRCFCTAKFFQKPLPNAVQVVSVPSDVKATPSLMQRCLLTLKLLTAKSKLKHSPEVISDMAMQTLKDKTYPNVGNKSTMAKKPYKLEPYECEPDVCIPGECDPCKCLKRIQGRREQSKSTPRHKISMSATSMRQHCKLRNHHVHSVIRHKKGASQSQERTRPSKEPRKSGQIHYGEQGQHNQAVKVGSNFSFNVEFSKSRTGGDQAVKIRKEPSADRNETRSTTSKPERRSSTRTTRSQGRSRVRDSDSQILDKKEYSTLTETKPFSKLCFCTSRLKKSHASNKNLKVIKAPNIQNFDIGIPTPKEKPFKNLLSQECEPGVCIPGQCDPYECLKLIEKRKMQTKMAYTDRQRGRRVSTKTTAKKTSIKGSQIQTDFKPNKKTYGYARDENVSKQDVNHSEKNKKAVRAGSTISFDVEFSKNQADKIPFLSDIPNVYSAFVGNKKSATDKKYRAVKCKFSDRKLNNRRSQSIARKPASSLSEVSNLIKRFHTLKLQKLGRLQRTRKLRTNCKIYKRKSIFNNKSLDSPHIQAVKIGSNDSFNIDFFGSRTGGDQIVKIRKKPRADRNETRSISSKPDRKRSTRTTKSQVLDNKVYSALTETKPFLERCFCTLKFKNVDKKSHAFNKNHEVIKPSNIQHGDIGISTPKEKLFKNVLPYECEPEVCVPGQSDPYECLKQIEKRNMQTKIAYTDRHRGRGLSNMTAENKTLTKGFPNQIDFKPIRTHGHAHDGKAKKRRVTHSAEKREAVRVKSSLSFDVEFSKNKTNKIQFLTDVLNVFPAFVGNEKIATAKKNRTVTCNFSDRKLNNRRSQPSASKITSTGFKISPLLQRCFYALKLDKLGRLQRPSKLRENSKIIEKVIQNNKTLDSTSIQYKDTEMGTKKRFRDIMLRPNTKENVLPTKNYGHHAETDNGPRKVVRIHSKFTFSIEFCKDHRHTKIRNTNVKLPKLDRAYNRKGEKLPQTSHGPIDQGQPMRYKDLQARVGQQHKPSSINPFNLKRLFPLKLKPSGPKVLVDHEAKPPLSYTNTSQNTIKRQKLSDLDVLSYITKKYKHILDLKKHKQDIDPKQLKQNLDPKKRKQDLDPKKRKLGISSECLDGIKRRNVTKNNAKRSQASLTPGSKSKRAQYSPKQKNKKETKISNTVEKTVLPSLNPKHHQVLQVGSNVSTNIEFYKKYAIPPNRKKVKRNTRDSRNITQDQTTCDCIQQADEEKSSIVGNALKRCFCTAKLGDFENFMVVGRVDKLITNSPFQTRKLQIYQMHQPKVKNRNRKDFACEPNCALSKTSTKNATTKINNKYLSVHPSNLADQKNEMKTILPYVPKKFNKKESKTLFPLKRKCNKKAFCANCPVTETYVKKGARGVNLKREKSLMKNKNRLKLFMCSCINTILKSKSKSNNNAVKKGLKISKSERTPDKKQVKKIKKSKSLNTKNTKVTSRKPCSCAHCRIYFVNGDYQNTVKTIKTLPHVESDNKSMIYVVKKGGGDLRTSKNTKRTTEKAAKGKKEHENNCQSEGKQGDHRQLPEGHPICIGYCEQRRGSNCLEFNITKKNRKSFRVQKRKCVITQGKHETTQHKEETAKNKEETTQDKKGSTKSKKVTIICNCNNMTKDTSKYKKGTTQDIEETAQNKKGTIICKCNNMTKGTSKYKKGTTQDIEEPAQNKKGTTKCKKGTTKCKKGTTKCKKGTTKYKKGTTKYKKGTTKCKKGTTKCKKGTAKCKMGTTQEDKEGTTKDKEVTKQDKKQTTQCKCKNMTKVTAQDMKGTTKCKKGIKRVKTTQGKKETCYQASKKSKKPCVPVYVKVAKKGNLTKTSKTRQKQKKTCICKKRTKKMETKDGNKKKKINEDKCVCNIVCECIELIKKVKEKKRKKKNADQTKKVSVKNRVSKNDKKKKEKEKHIREKMRRETKKNRSEKQKQIRDKGKKIREKEKKRREKNASKKKKSLKGGSKKEKEKRVKIEKKKREKEMKKREKEKTKRGKIGNKKREKEKKKREKEKTKRGKIGNKKREKEKKKREKEKKKRDKIGNKKKEKEKKKGEKEKKKRDKIENKKREKEKKKRDKIEKKKREKENKIREKAKKKENKIREKAKKKENKIREKENKQCEKKREKEMKEREKNAGKNHRNIRKKKKGGRKEIPPIGFECSPYVATLRKRPWLCVYRKCPRFYPHCLSILNIWRRFTDILMFLLAIVVWSPCILLIEACRAMFCFLGTG